MTNMLEVRSAVVASSASALIDCLLSSLNKQKMSDEWSACLLQLADVMFKLGSDSVRGALLPLLSPSTLVQSQAPSGALLPLLSPSTPVQLQTHGPFLEFLPILC